MPYDVSALTMNPEEAQDISKAIFEKFLEQGDLSEYHEIETGIEHKTQIAFIGLLGKVGKKILNCKPDANGSLIPVTEKFWDPVLIGDRFENCALDMNTLFKLFKKAQKINPDFYENLGGEAMGVVAASIEQAMEEMLTRIIWFGDTTIANVSGAGYLKNGEDVAFYNMLNGFWKQIQTEIPTSSKYYVEISQNGGADYAAQANLPADFALQLFRNMWKKSDSRLKQLRSRNLVDIQLHVTPDIYENWEDFLEDQSLAFTLSRAEEGSNTQSYRGIKIIPRYDWQSVIESDFDNGTTFHLPNRAFMTVKGNVPVGTLSTEDLQKLKSFYDDYNEVNVMDFRMTLDVKFLEDYLAVAAY